MTAHMARLVLVFGLALLASVARGQNSDATTAKPDAPRVQMAGFGFVSLPQVPKPESIRVIESDEEVVIVEETSLQAN